MRAFGTLVALLLVSLLVVRGDAHAMVIAQMPPPDFDLTLDIAPRDYPKMQAVLMDFGRSENLVPGEELEPKLKNPPRARDKQFYLFMTSRNSSRVFVAEKAPSRVFHIECYELSSGSGILPMVTHLQSVLQKQWPDIPLKVESPWLQRHPPPPVHLLSPEMPGQRR